MSNETKRNSGLSIQIIGWCLAMFAAAMFLSLFLVDNSDLVSK